MIRKSFLLILILFPFCTFGAVDGVNVKLNVMGCNNNGICEAETGEEINSCPLDCTIVIPENITGPSGSIPSITAISRENSFIGLHVTAFENHALISWQSAFPSLYTIRWGKTVDYSDGSLQSTVFSKDHQADITGLKEGVTYYANIASEDVYGRTISSPNLPFITLSTSSIPLPENPLNFSGSSSDSGVFLSWSNPKLYDWSYVRILRSEKGYPKDPFSGKLIYEGKKENFLDKNITEGVKYFYAIYSRNDSGVFSSGAFISVIFEKSEEKYEETEPVVSPVNTSPEKKENVKKEDTGSEIAPKFEKNLEIKAGKIFFNLFDKIILILKDIYSVFLKFILSVDNFFVFLKR